MARLDTMLSARGLFLGGEHPSLADLFIASDLFALDIDSDRSSWFAGFQAIDRWLGCLREREGYRRPHAPWNAVVPRVKELLSEPMSMPRDPAWVADVCREHMP